MGSSDFFHNQIHILQMHFLFELVIEMNTFWILRYSNKYKHKTVYAN